MKKIFIAILLVVDCLTVKAQTNFRTITYQQALAAAKTESKMVFMDFYTDWCGPCKLMAREVFPQKLVGDFFNSRFVCLKVNAEKGEGIALAKQYKPAAYPTFIIIAPDEKVVGRTEGYRPADQFVENINRMIDPTLTPEKMKTLYEQGNRSAELIKAYAAWQMESLLKQGRRVSNYTQRAKEVRKMVQDYFMPLTDAQKLSDENLFVYRTYTNRVTDPAARFMVGNRGRFGANNSLIDSTLQVLYTNEMRGYLSGNIAYNAQVFGQFRSELASLGFNKDGSFNLPIELVEAGQQGMESYLSTFDHNFSRLTTDYRYSAMQGIVSRYGKTDATTSRKASQHIRNFMPDMGSNMMFNAFMYIEQLEQKK